MQTVGSNIAVAPAGMLASSRGQSLDVKVRSVIRHLFLRAVVGHLWCFCSRKGRLVNARACLILKA